MKTLTVIKVFLVASILASCTPAATPGPIIETVVPSSTSEPVPAATLSNTPTPIPSINLGGQSFPDPHFSNPELFDLVQTNSPIPQFVHALNVAGVDVSAQRISESLYYKSVNAKNGDMVVLLLSTDLAETEFNEGNIPLLIYLKDQETGIYAWRIAYLKDVASLHNILVGTVDVDYELNEQTGIFSNNFNMVTITWSSVDVPIDIMDRDTRYRLSRLANESLQEIMWFHLGDIPLENQSFASLSEAVLYTNGEIDKIVQKYGDQITIANIFNEVNPYTKTIYQWWKKFGDEYLIEVYQHVREILPNSKIIYNENYNWSRYYEGSTYQYTIDIVNVLRDNDLIDAVGMEMHMAQNIWGIGNKMDITETASIMQEFELPVFVTELDVNQTPMSGTEQEKLVQQAQIYEDVVRACVRSEVCEMINFWGMLDQNSWYEFAVGEMNAEACIFDDDGTPKLAYYGVLRGLTEGYIISMP